MIFNMSWLSILFLNYFLSPSFLACFILSLLVAYLLPFSSLFRIPGGDLIWSELSSHLISKSWGFIWSRVKTLHPSPSSKPKHLADLAFNSMIFHAFKIFQDNSTVAFFGQTDLLARDGRDLRERVGGTTPERTKSCEQQWPGFQPIRNLWLIISPQDRPWTKILLLRMEVGTS